MGRKDDEAAHGERNRLHISLITTFFPPWAYVFPVKGMDTGRSLFILLLVIVTIAVAVALNGGGIPSETRGENATLTGNVSIGPLCPVEPCRLSHDQLVAAYAARPFSVTVPGGPVVATIIADPDTGYAISLRPGTYTVVDTRYQGIGGSRDLPKTITLRSDEMVWLNISVDTGIR